jgi:predicted SAM-dependent methyltransferase
MEIADYTNLNLGCGPRVDHKLPRPWLNVDISGSAADVISDIRTLPLDWTGHFREVRASHVLEHFFLRDMERALGDWTRVLQPNGILRIIVPDLDIVVASLARSNDPKGRPSETTQGTSAVLAQIFGVGYDSPDTGEAWRHRFLFSKRTLVELLGRVPDLVSIECYPREEDPAYSSAILDDSQNCFSLRVRARKVYD